jgi:hypothetical protein
MRPDRPSVDELLEAVEEFLRDHAMPALPGHLSFHARVAANVVGIARREITQSDQIEADQLSSSALTDSKNMVFVQDRSLLFRVELFG